MLLRAVYSLRLSIRVQIVYATACCTSQIGGDGSFMPLTVHYSERFSAAGRTTCGLSAQLLPYNLQDLSYSTPSNTAFLMKPCSCTHLGTCILSPTLQHSFFELVLRGVSLALIDFETTPDRSIWL